MATKKKEQVKEPKIKQIRAKEVPNAFVVSQYYGFNAIDLPEIIKEDKEYAKKLRKDQKYENESIPETEENIALLRGYKERNFEEEHIDPVMLYCEGHAKGSTRKPKRGEKVMSLHVIGTPKSIAEALLIKTTICILNEEGFKDVSVEINNLGGKEAVANFLRELTAYYRKNINEMDSECRQLFKDSTHALVACGNTMKEEVKAQAPTPFNFLSDTSKGHLKEVVEFLDEEGISYDVNKDILGNQNYSSSTVFTIIDKKSGKILATGSRYNQLAKKTGHKRNVPGIGVTIKLQKPKTVPSSRLPKPDKVRFFFIQIGFAAKIKSLKVMEELRKAKIPVHQSISNDKLSVQLARAKKFKVPYILIMGQQEAQDGTVVVRDTHTHSQTPIPLDDLVEHLKKLK